MAVLYQVNGPALIYVSPSVIPGVASAFTAPGGNSWLGICRESVNIAITRYDEPIRADIAGPRIPVDVQQFGKDAMIRFTLSEYDPTILDIIEALGTPFPGNLAASGAPMALSGLTFSLNIPSNYKPWTFPTCIMRHRRDMEGTEYSKVEIEMYAFAYWGNGNPSVTSAGVSASPITPLFLRSYSF